MNNLEWLKNNNDILENVLCFGLLAVNKETGKVSTCGGDVRCSHCLFDSRYRDGSCIENRKKWLHEEHESLYKRGDVVIFIPSKHHCKETRIGVVSKNECNGTVIITYNVSNVEQHLDVIDDVDGVLCNVEDIVMKIDNIFTTKEV